jgi:hypothetical protein
MNTKQLNLLQKDMRKIINLSLIFVLIFYAFDLKAENKVDCSEFYKNVDKVDKNLKYLKKSFVPIKTDNWNRLLFLKEAIKFNNLSESNKDEFNKNVNEYYSNYDLSKFEILNSIDSIINNINYYRSKMIWDKDKEYLNKIVKGEFFFENNSLATPFDNLEKYIELQLEMTQIVTDFKKMQSNFEQNIFSQMMI